MIGDVETARPVGGAARGLRDALLVGGPKLVGAALAFALNLSLLRFLGVEQYGVWSLCAAVILLADAVIGAPVDLAVLRLASPGANGAAVERAALQIKMAMTLLAGLVTGAALGAGAFAARGDWPLAALTAAAVAAGLALRSVLVHLQRRQRFPAYGAVDALHVALKFGAIGGLLALAAPGVAALLALFAAGPLLAALAGAVFFARHLLDVRALPRSVYGRLGRLGGWYLATVSLGALINALDALALGWLAPIGELGTYAAGQAIASAPGLLGTYLAVITMPRVLEAARAGALPRFFRRGQVALLAAGLLGGALAFAAWSAVAGTILPAGYAGAAAIVPILLPGTIAAMVAAPLALPVVMFWRKTLVLRMDCVVLPALAILYAAVIPDYGATGAAWVTVSALILRSGVVLAAAWHCVAGDEWAGIASTEDGARA